MGRLASIQALRMIKALARLGWTVARVSGSHHILAKPGHPPVTIPVKKGATLKEGTARSILKQAGVSEDDFFQVY
jgi:predicted RNA binding protein YcfA (HicA-like mRNA interferase family)